MRTPPFGGLKYYASFQERDDFLDAPYVIRDPCFHRGTRPKLDHMKYSATATMWLSTLREKAFVGL